MKRLFDVLFSATAILVFSPLFVLIALRIKLDSRHGPVFYRSKRIGRGGRPFQLFKFRTMVANADKIGGPSTPEDDPRITRVGKSLRKYKLDELPQFFNVFAGTMSIVGPRPEVPQYTALLTEEERVILSVRPGITDWASLWNCDEGAALAGSDDPEQTYLQQIRPKKLVLQVAYVKSQSFFTDLSIIFHTAQAIVFRSKRLPTAPPQRGSIRSWKSIQMN